MSPLKGIFKKLLFGGNTAPVHPLGHIEKTMRFEYEIEKNDITQLNVRFIGMEDEMELNIHMTAHAGETLIKKERLFTGYLGNSHYSPHESIQIDGVEHADKICIRYTEGDDAEAGDEGYHSFGRFCIDMQKDTAD